MSDPAVNPNGYAFLEGEWHRIAVPERDRPGYRERAPAVTGCGLRLERPYATVEALSNDMNPTGPRCGCAGKETA